jgi:hypothetical protein
LNDGFFVVEGLGNNFVDGVAAGVRQGGVSVRGGGAMAGCERANG